MIVSLFDQVLIALGMGILGALIFAAIGLSKHTSSTP